MDATRETDWRSPLNLFVLLWLSQRSSKNVRIRDTISLGNTGSLRG